MPRLAPERFQFTSADGLSIAWKRLQFAFTLTYHYLFPQLTMGLATVYFVFILRRDAGKVSVKRDNPGFY